jgi:Tol biopolymer transport system component
VTAGDVGQGRAQVYLLDITTGKKEVLVNTDYGDFVASTWAPDGKHVLLVARKNTIGSGAGGLWILNMESNSLEHLLDSGYAVWSPNGKTIATFSVEGINTVSEKVVLSLIDVDTKNITEIYENLNAKYFFGLSWSPDGENLVFSLGEDPENLYTLNVQTGQATQITEGIKSTAPVWSPVGNIIAYVSWPTTGIRKTLHFINSDGKCDIQIPNLEYVWSPTWSPDGKKLAYIARDGIYFLEIEKIFGRDIYQGLCDL